MSRQVDTPLFERGWPDPATRCVVCGGEPVARLAAAPSLLDARCEAGRSGRRDGSGAPQWATRRGIRWVRRLAELAIAASLLSAIQGCDRLTVREGDEGKALVFAPAAVPEAMPATGAITVASGCQVDYRVYRPTTRTSRGLTILGHGFLRSKERMEGLAMALADAGLTAVALDFCNSRPWDGQHEQNGLEMVALAERFDARHVIYAGFSAGALAALVAGAQDPRTLGVIALDPVDEGGVGVRAAVRLDRPLIGIIGEPSACNLNGNAWAILAASRRGRVVRVPGASHCDFEHPGDGLCELVCGSTSGGIAMRQAIIQAAVSAAIRLLPSADA